MIRWSPILARGWIALCAASICAAGLGQPGGAADSGSWHGWLTRPVLLPDEAASMIPRFLEQQLAPLPLPATREAWLRQREQLRRDVLRSLGIDDWMPPAWDIDVRSKGSLQREGYRIEKLTFQSYPGMAIPALLYLPDRVAGRVPGVISISGHTLTSKAADYVQQRNVNLVLRGCVVLAYDYYGYGERKTGDHPHHPRGANAHDLRSFSFTRRSATAIEVLDAIRAVDVLAARPEVDAARIGFTGESGGSNSTYWAAAIDQRVKLSVPVCSVTTFDYWIRTDVNWDWHQRPPGIRRSADIGSLLALHAPRPVLVISSLRGTDLREFPLEEADKSFQWARHVYGLFGEASAAALYESSTAHGYHEDKRAQLYLAVERWLQPPHPRGATELPAQVESAEALRCGLPENNLTLQAIYAEWTRDLPRPAPSGGPAALRRFLRERLGWPDALPTVRGEKIGEEQTALWSADFWLIESEAGIRLPAVRIVPAGAAAGVTIVPGRDRSAVARELARGRTVVAFDPRGLGGMRRRTKETDAPPAAGASWPALLSEMNGSPRNWAWFAGRPWAGQWALDLAQVARFCREKFGGDIAIEAENAFGWPALLAGAAAPEHIAAGNVHVPWVSLREDVRLRGDQALADVPGILEHLDIPQLQALWPGGSVRVRK